MSGNKRDGRNGLLAKLAFGLTLLLAGQQAFAAPTAANAILQNTVTVNFDNSAGLAQPAVSASVSITVLLKPATPTLTKTGSSPTNLNTVVETQTFTIDYTITSNANGPDTYALSYALGTESSIQAGSPTTVNAGSPSSVTLGATTVVENYTSMAAGLGTGGEGDCVTPDTGYCTIKVANDNSNTDGIVNGLAAGDAVELGTSGTVCTIKTGGITDNGGAVTDVTVAGGYSTIVLQNCSAADASISVGDGMYGQQSITVSLTAGKIDQTSGATSSTGTVTTTAQGASPSAAATDAQGYTIILPHIAVSKLVRDITNPIVGDTTTNPGNDANGNPIRSVLTVNDGSGSATFYKTGVKAKPGDVLEYAVIVENVGSTDATNVTLQDNLTAFTTYQASSLIDIEAGTLSCTTNAWTCSATVTTGPTTLTDVAGDDAGTYNAGPPPSVSINPGTGATASTGGTVSTGNVSIVFYKVKVD